MEKIFVERELIEKNDKSFYSYFIKGKVRGRDVRVAISVPDVGGFTVLDVVFGNDMKAELVVTPFEMKDEKTGKVTYTGNRYGVRNVDEEGNVYECQIKPFRSSDKALLEMLLK